MPNSSQESPQSASDRPFESGPNPVAGPLRVAPVYLQPLVDESRRLGIPTVPFFRGLGFTAAALDRPGFLVTHPEAATVTRRALQAFGDPSLGLRLGMRSRITHHGVLALGLLASPTLKASIELLLRYPSSAGFLLDVRAVESAERFVIVAESLAHSHDLGEFLVDKLFAGWVRRQRQLSDTDCSPRLVELMRPPRADALDHEQHYRCPVRFNSKANRLVFDPTTLSGPLPTANTMCLRTAQALLDIESVAARGGSAFGESVRRAIASSLPTTPTTPELASMLHISERSLRRKLAQEHLSFRALLDASRRTRALDLLNNAQRSVAEAAAEVGFGDLRSFRRAMRRWTADARPVSPDAAGDADGQWGAD